MSSQLLRTKSIDELIRSSEQEGKRLTRSLGPVSLTALGLGAVLGTGIPAGIWDIGSFADLSNTGTLFAFIVVSAGVILLRRKQPDRPRGFRVPLVPLFPPLAIGFCLILMLRLPLQTWVRSGA